MHGGYETLGQQAICAEVNFAAGQFRSAGPNEDTVVMRISEEMMR